MPQFVADMVVGAGFIPAGPKGTEGCSTPSFYAAQGACTTTSTQNPDGSTTIGWNYVQSCYAVRDFEAANGTFSLSPAGNDQCDNAVNSTEAKEIIARYLRPYLWDPSALVKNCYSGGGVALNYQRDTEYRQQSLVDQQIHVATYENSDKWPDGISDYEIRTIQVTYPYVCTDIDPGDLNDRPTYFRNELPVGSTFSADRYPCNVQREIDKERLRAQISEAARHCQESADADDLADGRSLSGRNHCVAMDIVDDGGSLTTIRPIYRDLHW